MIGTMLGGAAALIAAPAVGGLAWRKTRQRRVAKALEITTPTGIVEQRFVRVGGIGQWIQLRGRGPQQPRAADPARRAGLAHAVFTRRRALTSRVLATRLSAATSGRLRIA